MNIGYCRVSTEDQSPDLQLTALQRAGCTRIFTDKATGVHVKRPHLTKCLTALQAGDVLIVWKMDRLGRSLRDLITLLDDLKAREVAFRSLTEAIDTTTPTGRAMWQMVGILAELERSLIQERTKAGRTAAQARGVKMGRKPLLSAQQVVHARQLLAQGERPVHVAHLLNVSRRTLERAVSRGGSWHVLHTWIIARDEDQQAFGAMGRAPATTSVDDLQGLVTVFERHWGYTRGAAFGSGIRRGKKKDKRWTYTETMCADRRLRRSYRNICGTCIAYLR